MNLGVLGQRIQQLRTDRGLTLHALADVASVSVSMLSSVERGEKAPTIVVLARIADGLGIPLGALVADADDRRLVVRRAAEQDVVDEPGGWRRVVLSPVVPGVNFDLVKTTLPPHCDAGEFPAYAPGSHEFVAVHSGTLELTVGEETVRLRAGDSVYFEADVPHGYANPAVTACTYYVAAMVMRPRRPGSRHSLATLGM